MLPDMSQIVVYGVPLTALVAGLMWVISAVAPGLSEKATKAIHGALLGIGFIVVNFLPRLEALWPDMPQVMPIVLVGLLVGLVQAGAPIFGTNRIAASGRSAGMAVRSLRE